MMPADSATQIMAPCSFTGTSRLLPAGVIREPALEKGRMGVAEYIVTPVTATNDSRGNQYHTEVPDILVVRRKLRITGIKRPGKWRRASRAGTGFPRLEPPGQKGICRLFRTTGGSVEFVRRTRPEYQFIVTDPGMVRGSP